MDNEHINKSHEETRPASLLQVDTFFFKKIIARNSMDSSSPTSDHHSVCEVPFDWESMPGTPRNPYRDVDTILPPIKPPPAVESVEMPKPAIVLSAKSSSKVCFWNAPKHLFPCRNKVKFNKKLPPRCPNPKTGTDVPDHQRSSSVSIASSTTTAPSDRTSNSWSSSPAASASTTTSSSLSHSSSAPIAITISRRSKSRHKSRSSKLKGLAKLLIQWIH